jgi:hypothetical protein
LSSVGDAVADDDDDEEDEDEEIEGFAESSEAKKKRDDPFAGYITKVLAANVPSSQMKYTSYSTRRGVLQQMGDASDNLRHADAAVRGGHVGTMKAMDTFFEYWATTNEHDNKAGEI